MRNPDKITIDDMGMTAKDLIDHKDPVVIDAITRFVAGVIDYEQFKAIVTKQVNVVDAAKNYDRAMQGI